MKKMILLLILTAIFMTNGQSYDKCSDKANECQVCIIQIPRLPRGRHAQPLVFPGVCLNNKCCHTEECFASCQEKKEKKKQEKDEL